MKRKLFAAGAFALACVFAGMAFAACAPLVLDVEQRQDQLDAFLEQVEKDEERYSVTITLTQGEENSAQFLAQNDGTRMYGRIDASGKTEPMTDVYSLKSGGYQYSYDAVAGVTDVDYVPEGGGTGVRSMTEAFLFLFSATPDFWSVFEQNVQIEDSGVTFAAEVTGTDTLQVSGTIENGTVVFEKDTVTISFTRVLTQEEEQEGAAQQAEAGETRLELVIAIKELGSFKGAATLPAAEAAFASVSQEDRLFAQAQWLFGATSAQIGAEFYGADEAAIAQYTAQLSEGQALAQLTYRGEAAMTSAVVLRGDDYYEVTPEDSAPVRGSAGRNVQRALRDFGFSALERESFALKAGTDDTLVFVGAAGAGFPACEAAELCCKADGSYTITLTGITEADLVGAESATVTLQKIGQAQPIAFPAAVTEALDAYFADLDA